MSETSSDSKAESLSGLSIVVVDTVDAVEILLAWRKTKLVKTLFEITINCSLGSFFKWYK